MDARRLAEHPVLTVVVLGVIMLTGSIAVSSTVEVALVGTSWLGLDSPAGVGVTIACSILSLMSVALVLFLTLGTGGEEDDEDWRDGGDEPPKPEGPSGEPVWWPGFEEEFAAYLADSQRDRDAGKKPSLV